MLSRARWFPTAVVDRVQGHGCGDRWHGTAIRNHQKPPRQSAAPFRIPRPFHFNNTNHTIITALSIFENVVLAGYYGHVGPPQKRTPRRAEEGWRKKRWYGRALTTDFMSIVPNGLGAAGLKKLDWRSAGDRAEICCWPPR